MKSAQTPRLVKAITNVGMTTAQIALAIYCTTRSARMIIAKLRAEGQVHIEQWGRTGPRGLPVAVWRYGIGVDAPKPPALSSTARVKKFRRLESLDDKAFRAARARGRRVKIRRDPLVAAFYGEVK